MEGMRESWLPVRSRKNESKRRKAAATRRCAPQKMEYVDVSNSTVTLADQMRRRQGKREIWERIAVDHTQGTRSNEWNVFPSPRSTVCTVCVVGDSSCCYCCCNISVTSRGMQLREKGKVHSFDRKEGNKVTSERDTRMQ